MSDQFETPDALAAYLASVGEPIVLHTLGWVTPEGASVIFNRISEAFPGVNMGLISVAAKTEFGFVPT